MSNYQLLKLIKKRKLFLDMIPGAGGGGGN